MHSTKPHLLGYFGFILALSICTAKTGDANLRPAEVQPRVSAEWRDSQDRKVSVCLSADKTTFASGEEIIVRCFVRSNTDAPITLVKPFGDDIFALGAGLTILGPTAQSSIAAR